MERPKPSESELLGIAEQAAASAEANVYSLDNPYLGKAEKLEVEMWFELPGELMIYAFLITGIASTFVPLSWTHLIGIPLAVNIVAGLINWYIYNKRIVYLLYLTLLHSWTVYAAGLATAVFLIFKGSYLLGAVALLAPFGVLAFLEPHLWFYPLLSSKYRVHPKYAFFKKEYGYTFPFEEHLPRR